MLYLSHSLYSHNIEVTTAETNRPYSPNSNTLALLIKVNVKQSCYRPGVAKRVPGK
jgi:hypothetical protein